MAALHGKHARANMCPAARTSATTMPLAPEFLTSTIAAAPLSTSLAAMLSRDLPILFPPSHDAALKAAAAKDTSADTKGPLAHLTSMPFRPSPVPMATTLVTSTYNPPLRTNSLSCATDALCPRPQIEAMIKDFLVLLYPLVPVVHRPTLRDDLQMRRDNYDVDFQGLVLALCDVLIA